MPHQESKRAKIAIASVLMLSIAVTIGILLSDSLLNDLNGTSGSHALIVLAPHIANAPASSDQSGDSWPMFHAALNHTGAVTTTPARGTSPTWTYKTGSMVVSSPAVAGGRLYIGSYDYNMYCLNATTGSKIWSYYIGNYILSSPAVANGRVYVGCYDDKLYCFNATTGGFIWSYLTSGYIENSPAVWGGRVYIGSANDYLYCLNATSGSFIWSYKTGNQITGSSPAITGGLVYVGSYDYKLYCLNATTGSFKWSYLTGNEVFSSPAIANGFVYVGSFDDKLYCLNAAIGSFIWSYTTGSLVESSPAIMNGRVYFGSGDSKIYCLNATTGSASWNYTTGGTIYSSSPAVVNGFVYEGSNDQRLYRLNATTGAFNWSFMTGSTVWGSPAVASGHVFFGSEDDYVYCIPLKVTSYIVITNPTSSSSWIAGGSYYVNWTWAGCSSTVTIDLYSGGSYYYTIASTASNIGYYYWTIPASIPAGYYQVFIDDYFNASIKTTSNSFYINTYSSITITSPTSSSSWSAGYSYYIDWSSSGSFSYVTIELYSGGSYYSTIATGVSNSGSYYWTIPSSIPSGYYQVFIEDYSNNGIYAYSNSFSISNNYITVTSPTASSSWLAGDSYYIDWSASGSFSYVTIELYSGGSYYTMIASGVSNSGSYYWTIPSFIPSGYYQVFIEDYYSSSIYGYSSSFYISGSSSYISISNPTSSSYWYGGDSYGIDWSSSGSFSLVTIELYSGGSYYTMIASGVSNSGYYYWTIPSSIPSGYYQVFIEDYYSSSIYSYSSSFYVSGSSNYISISNPSATSDWTTGSSYYIEWTSVGVSSDVNIDLYSGGSYYTTIATFQSNTGSYYWTIPTNIPSGTYQVYIDDYSETGINARSSSFYIDASGSKTGFDSGQSSAIVLIVLGVFASILIPTAAHKIRMKKQVVPFTPTTSASQPSRSSPPPRISSSPRSPHGPVSGILPRSAFVQQLVNPPTHANAVPPQPVIRATPAPAVAPPDAGFHPGTPKWERLARFDISQYTTPSDAQENAPQVADGTVHDGIRVMQGVMNAGAMPAPETETTSITEQPTREASPAESIDEKESKDATVTEAPSVAEQITEAARPEVAVLEAAPVAEQITEAAPPEMAILIVTQADLKKKSPGHQPSAIVLACPDCGTLVQADSLNENLAYFCKKCKKAMEMEVWCPSCFGKTSVGQDDFDASGGRALICPVCFEPLNRF